MRRAARFLFALLLGLAVLGTLGNLVLARTTRAWFEHDLTLRSQLAVASASKSLSESWSDSIRLTEVLDDMTRDERIMGAAACSPSQQRLASTTTGSPTRASGRCAISRTTAPCSARKMRMPEVEQRERMQSMRRLVSEFNVYRWAGRMLVDAAEQRRRERMTGRFSHS